MSKDEPLVSWEELAVSTMLEVQAIIKILERKGLVTSDEVFKGEQYFLFKRPTVTTYFE